jgi:hypothetical protein
MLAVTLAVTLMLTLGGLTVTLVLAMLTVLAVLAVLAVALGRRRLLRGGGGGDGDGKGRDEVLHDETPEKTSWARFLQADRGGGGSDPGAVPARKALSAARKAARGGGAGSKSCEPPVMAEQAMAQSAERPRSFSSCRSPVPAQCGASADA